MRDSCAQPHLFLKIQWPRQLLSQIRAVFQFQFADWDGQWCFAALLYCKRVHSHGTSPGEPYPHRSLCTKHCMWHWAPVRHFFHPSLLVPSISSLWTPHTRESLNRKDLERLLMTQCVQQVLYIYTYSLIMTYITSFGWFISPCLLIKKKLRCFPCKNRDMFVASFSAACSSSALLASSRACANKGSWHCRQLALSPKIIEKTMENLEIHGLRTARKLP